MAKFHGNSLLHSKVIAENVAQIVNSGAKWNHTNSCIWISIKLLNKKYSKIHNSASIRPISIIQKAKRSEKNGELFNIDFKADYS